MAELRMTDTNAADDSKGAVWGLDGDLFIPVVASAALSLGVLMVLYSVLGVHWLLSAVMGAAPFGLTLGYVLTFRQGKPPGYDRDLFDRWMNGDGFSFDQRGQEAYRPPRKENT